MQRNRRKITAGIFILILLLFILYFFSSSTGGHLASRVVGQSFSVDLRSDDVVQLDSLTGVQIDAKKGEFILSMHRDDINELVGVPIRKFIPENPSIILHDPDLCRDQPDLRWILYVHSAPGNFDRRQMLRETYANTKLFKKIRFKVAFFLGLSRERGMQEEIKKEFDQHGDIVQGFYMDDYKNMTIKAVMAINWISDHCPQVPFAIKVDDDTFLNVFAILPFLEENSGKPRVVVCPVWRENSMLILRDRKFCMKWCVSKRDFPGKYYPRYCAGINYVLSIDLVKELRKATLKTPFFWIDDVYVTGLLVQKVAGEVEYVDTMKHFTVHQEGAVEQYANESQPITTYLVHVKEKKYFLPLWNSLLKRLTKEQRDIVDESVLKT